MADSPCRGTSGTMGKALRSLPGVGPKAAQRMALHLLQHDRDGARSSRACAAACGHDHSPLRTLQHVHRRRPLRVLPFGQARLVAAVHRRDAGRPPDGRADAGLLRPLLRADGTSVAARWHRSEGNPARPSDQARDRRGGEGGSARDQLHQRRRGHRPLHRRVADRTRVEGQPARAGRSGRR